MKKTLTAVATTVAIATFGGTAFAAPSLVIDIGNVTTGDVGTTRVIASADVDPDLVGETCVASVEVLNNGSVHPNNDLIISSNGSTFRLDDVEGDVDSDTTVTTNLTLGPTVSVSIEFGDDGFFSGGFDVEFECSDDVPSTSEPEPSPTDNATTTEGGEPSPTDNATTTTTDGGGEPGPTDNATTTTDGGEPGPTDNATTTIAGQPAPTTTTTGSVIPAGPTTTAPGSGTPDPDDTLPSTGSGLGAVWYGAMFLALGGGLIALSRRRTSEI